MLDTKLKHLETKEEMDELLNNNEKAMICCGRMGPMCIPVYSIMEKLELRYPRIQFRDMDFDILVASLIKNLPECSFFMGLPFTVYFKNGTVVKATTSIQKEKEIVDILELL